MTLTDLIAALERAEGPSRELDSAIAAHVGEAVMPFQPDEHAWMCKDGQGGWMPITRPGSRPHTINDRYVPRYTASLDAALTLVPEGWASASINDRRGPIGYVHNNELAFVGISGRENPAKVWHKVRHPVRAIALCIAALKARA